MPEGGTLRLSAVAEEIGRGHSTGLPLGRYVRLSITDTGEGMDEVTLRRATEPFFTTKGIGKGTGLGLSTVHGFAEQSDGRLRLSSAVGVGTTADIWLPAAIETIGTMPSTTVPLVEKSRQLRVLAVDDDPLVLMNTVAMLEDLGHEVVQANSAQKALQILSNEGPTDLVLTDQAMPRMNGSQLAKAIHDVWPEVPIVLATGYSELPPGADSELPRLSKPFTQRELAAAVSAATA